MGIFLHDDLMDLAMLMNRSLTVIIGFLGKMYRSSKTTFKGATNSQTSIRLHLSFHHAQSIGQQ
jgi:hypothetical protein